MASNSDCSTCLNVGSSSIVSVTEPYLFDTVISIQLYTIGARLLIFTCAIKGSYIRCLVIPLLYSCSINTDKLSAPE